MSNETELGNGPDAEGAEVAYEGPSVSTTQERADLVSSIAGLNATLQGLLTSTEAMASKEYVAEWQREQERKRSRFVAMVVSVGVCFLLIFALMGFTLAKVYDFTDRIDANTETVLDCTSPVDDNGEPNACYTRRRAIQDASQAKESKKIIDQVTDEIVRKVTRNIIKWAEEQMQAGASN